MGSTCQNCQLFNEKMNLELDIEQARHNKMKKTREERIFDSERKLSESIEFSKDFVNELFDLINVVRNNPQEFINILMKYKRNFITNRNNMTYYVRYLNQDEKLEHGIETFESYENLFQTLNPMQKLQNTNKLKINTNVEQMTEQPEEYFLEEYNKYKNEYDYEKMDYFYLDNFPLNVEELVCIGFCDESFVENKLVKLILNPNYNQISVNMYQRSYLFIIFANEKEDEF